MVYKLKKVFGMVLCKLYRGIIIDFKIFFYFLFLLYCFRVYKYSNYYNLEYRYIGKYIV